MLKKIAFAVGLIFLLLVGAIFLFAKDIEVSVSEREAQSSIDAFLKAEAYDKKGVRVLPEYISIDFKDDNRAQVQSRVEIDGYGYKGTFTGTFASGINYRRPRLYLSDLLLINGGFQADDETQSELSEMKKVATDILRRQRERIKIDKSENPLDTSEEKSGEIIDEIVQSATKALFESIPIYNLERAEKGGFAASLALKDVRFTEENAIITLSPVTALLRILTALGIMCLSLMWIIGYLFMNFGFLLPKKNQH